MFDMMLETCAQDRGLQLFHPADPSALRFLRFPDDVVGLHAYIGHGLLI